MPIKFTRISKILVIATVASLCSIQVARAEKTKEPISLNEAFKRTYFKHGKDAFQQNGILGQANFIFGFTEFADRHIAKDAKAVDKLYQYGMDRQSRVGMPLMTQDLENPYQTSLSENMEYIGY